MTDSVKPDTRSIEIEHEVSLAPEVVFQAITDPAEVARWFPLAAEIDSRVGGRIWFSWGPGCEGEAPRSASRVPMPRW